MFEEILHTSEETAITLSRTVKLPPSTLREIGEQFSLYDKDGNGTIDLMEFTNIVNTIGGMRYGPEELRQIFNRLDNDLQGSIDKEEFVAFMANHFTPISADEECDLLFEMIDHDHSGSIEALELTAFLLGWWRGNVEGSQISSWFPPTVVKVDGDDDALRLGRDSVEVSTTGGSTLGASHAERVQLLRRRSSFRMSQKATALARWPDDPAQTKLVTNGFQLEKGATVVVTERIHPIADITPAEVQMLIRDLDEDRTGTIEKDELKQLLRRFT
jgi:Ca2+-binding EF-hand superfamily protein